LTPSSTRCAPNPLSSWETVRRLMPPRLYGRPAGLSNQSGGRRALTPPPFGGSLPSPKLGRGDKGVRARADLPIVAQARMPLTTSPWTSVRRKSRPA
jgi:hypothetical protein